MNTLTYNQVEDEYAALAKAISNWSEYSQSCGLVNWMSTYQDGDKSTALEKAIANSNNIVN